MCRTISRIRQGNLTLQHIRHRSKKLPTICCSLNVNGSTPSFSSLRTAAVASREVCLFKKRHDRRRGTNGIDLQRVDHHQYDDDRGRDCPATSPFGVLLGNADHPTAAQTLLDHNHHKHDGSHNCFVDAQYIGIEVVKANP